MADCGGSRMPTVRDQVGVFDASTLGKIEVVGPDAAEFLDRIYVNRCRSWSPAAAAMASC